MRRPLWRRRRRRAACLWPPVAGETDLAAGQDGVRRGVRDGTLSGHMVDADSRPRGRPPPGLASHHRPLNKSTRKDAIYPCSPCLLCFYRPEAEPPGFHSPFWRGAGVCASVRHVQMRNGKGNRQRATGNTGTCLNFGPSRPSEVPGGHSIPSGDRERHGIPAPPVAVGPVLDGMVELLGRLLHPWTPLAIARAFTVKRSVQAVQAILRLRTAAVPAPH